MLHITPTKQDRNWIWIPLLVISAALHLFLLHAGLRLEQRSDRVYGPSQVRFQLKQPPAKAPPKAAPKPQAPRPRPKPAPAPTRVARSRRRQPATEQAVEQQPARQQQPEARVEPVFGVSNESLTTGDSTVSVRQGNTLAKQMERRMVTPGWATRLPATAPALPASKPRRVRPVPLFKLTRTPSFKHKVAPVYPALARQRKVEGKVLLEVLIDAQGHVSTVRVLEAPDDSLAQAAVAALRRSSMTPGQVGQHAVPVKLTIPYRFVLDG